MPYTTLISTCELSELINRNAATVIDCRFDLQKPQQGQQDWQASHIPGARYAHLNNDLAAPVRDDTGRHPLPPAAEFIHRLQQWGIENHKQVVVYDDASGSFAARLWWMLRWIGHKQVAVLDGGWSKWISDGFPVDSAVTQITPTDFSGEADDNQWLTTEDVSKSLQDARIKLIDARTAERFNGREEPIDPVAGHVPGAVNFPLQNNVDKSGCFLPAKHLRECYMSLLKDIPANQVVHMCGSGVTACHNLLTMEQAGLHGSKLYVGSWSEWLKSGEISTTTS